MLELTGEQFSKSVLDRARLRKEYFNDEGRNSIFISFFNAQADGIHVIHITQINYYE